MIFPAVLEKINNKPDDGKCGIARTKQTQNDNQPMAQVMVTKQKPNNGVGTKQQNKNSQPMPALKQSTSDECAKNSLQNWQARGKKAIRTTTNLSMGGGINHHQHQSSGFQSNAASKQGVRKEKANNNQPWQQSLPEKQIINL